MILRQIVLAVLTAFALLHPAAAQDQAVRPDRQPKIVVIGAGETMDALERALEAEVAIINEDGGVMGRPLELTRIDTDCAAQTTAAAAEIAERRPFVVFQDYCGDASLEAAQAFADAQVLFMGVGDWPPALTEPAARATVFRLAPRNGRRWMELAFAMAAGPQQTLHWKAPASTPEDIDTFEEVAAELSTGFVATDLERARWGEFVQPASKTFTRPDNDALPTDADALLVLRGPEDFARTEIETIAKSTWRGRIIVALTPGQSSTGAANEASVVPPSRDFGSGDWLTALAPDLTVEVFQPQPFHLGQPPAGAKAYTAFHPDWVAGFWQVMKAVKTAKSLDGRDIAWTLGGPPFFARAPWMMLQSRSRYAPPELRQRFNDNGDLRMAAYRLETIWPKR